MNECIFRKNKEKMINLFFKNKEKYIIFFKLETLKFPPKFSSMGLERSISLNVKIFFRVVFFFDF